MTPSSARRRRWSASRHARLPEVPRMCRMASRRRRTRTPGRARYAAATGTTRPPHRSRIHGFAAVRPACSCRRKRESRIVANTVVDRQPTRQQRCVGRQGLRRVGVGAIEDDGLVGHRIDRGGIGSLRAVGRQVDCRHAVDRDEEDRALMRRGLARPPPADGGGSCHCDEEQRDDERRHPAASRDTHAGCHR